MFSIAALRHVTPTNSNKNANTLGSNHSKHHYREAEMLKLNRQFLVLALPLAAAFAFVATSDAFAQKKLSHEQAWAACKAQIDRTMPGDQQTARASAGAGCMQKYGYRLKKKK
jgi:hypothetical protein